MTSFLRCRIVWGVLAACAACAATPSAARAGALNFISDTISTSWPGAQADHTLRLQTTGAVPPGGRIIVVPEDGAFNVPAGLDHTDVDFATATSLAGPYTERTLAAVASGSDDGVSVVSGSSGRVTITLSSGTGLGAGEYARILIGAHAIAQTTGDAQLENATTARSHSILVYTENAASARIDEMLIWIAMVYPVVMGPADTTDRDPPFRFNGLPSGSSIPSGITQVVISLETNEFAYCRYATVSSVDFASMTSSFEAFSNRHFHQITISGLADNATYHHYVRCRDTQMNANPDDYDISFTIGTPLPPPGPGSGRGAGPGGGDPGPPQPGGGGGAPQPTLPPPTPTRSPNAIPSGLPYPPSKDAPRVTLTGYAFPLSPVTVLRDGQAILELVAETSGAFRAEELIMPTQGVYTLGVWAADSAGNRSALFNSTFSAASGTRTLIANVVIPPTLALAGSEEEDAPLVASGESAPGALVEVEVMPTDEDALPEETQRLIAVADPSGRWSLEVDRDALVRETYEVRARATVPNVGTSTFGTGITIGRGGALSACQRSDLNGDGRVNFTDFSILLFNWGRSGGSSDINQDGRVNLADFSILLTCWTG